MNLLRGNTKKVKDEEEHKEISWQELHAGLKLRNIVQSKRMNELDLRSGVRENKLVI